MSETKNEMPPQTDQVNPGSPPTENALTETDSPPPIPTEGAPTAEATLGQRCGAYLIDALIAFGLSMITSKLGSISSMIGMAYILVKDALPFLDGQSLGKKVLGIKAVTDQGASLAGNWNPGLVRNAVLLIPFFAIVELIVLVTKKDAPEGLLRLGDQWAKTKVIYVGK